MLNMKILSKWRSLSSEPPVACDLELRGALLPSQVSEGVSVLWNYCPLTS